MSLSERRAGQAADKPAPASSARTITGAEIMEQARRLGRLSRRELDELEKVLAADPASSAGALSSAEILERVQRYGGLSRRELAELENLLATDPAKILPAHMAQVLAEVYRAYTGAGASRILLGLEKLRAPGKSVWSRLRAALGFVSGFTLSGLVLVMTFNSCLFGSIVGLRVWPIPLLTSLVILVAGLAASHASVRHFVALDDWVQRKLEGSGLAERWMLGSNEVMEAWQSTPYFWRVLFLGPPPNTAKRAVKVLTYNLDWFIQPPRAYFRLSWPALLFANTLGWASGGLVSLTFSAMTSSSTSKLLQYGVLMLLLLVVCSIAWLATLGRLRAQLFLARFYPYLLQRLGS